MGLIDKDYSAMTYRNTKQANTTTGFVDQCPGNQIPPHPARQRGFTIVELMITVAIAAILAGVAFPSFQYTIANSQVRTAATDVHMSLLLARSEAIKRNSDVVIERGAAWKDGWDVKSGSTVIRSWDSPGDIAIDCYTDTGGSTNCSSTVTFKRAGRAESYVEYRVYDNNNNNIPARCVIVSLSGRAGVTLDSDNNPGNGCG